MSLIPSIFGGRRRNSFDPFSLDVWDPFQGFPFNTDTSLLTTSTGGETSAFVNARIDWKETPEAHVFKADLPGVKKEEVKVEVEDGRVLQISGERSRDKEEKNDRWHRVERSSGSFVRKFRLPDNVKMEEVKASMENGVLTVTVPKVEEGSLRRSRSQFLADGSIRSHRHVIRCLILSSCDQSSNADVIA